MIAVLVGQARQVRGQHLVDNQTVRRRQADAARLFPAGLRVFVAGGILVGRLPAVRRQRVGLVALQRRHLDRVDRLARAVEKIYRLAQRGNLEPRVQRFARLRFVRSVAEDDDARPGLQRHLREDKQHPVVPVGQADAAQALRRHAGVGDFNPVRVRARFVGVGALIRAHHLGDGERRLFQRRNRRGFAAVCEDRGFFRHRLLGQQRNQRRHGRQQDQKQQPVAHGRAASGGRAAPFGRAGILSFFRSRLQSL